MAASILGRPRVTGDVDVLVWLADEAWEASLRVGERFGLRPRRPDVLAFARRARVLLLRHEPSGIDVDVTIGALPFEEASIARARRRRVGGVTVPLVTPEDLIVMKAIAHRPRDLADIEAVVSLHRRLDRARIVRSVREFAAVLEAPELVRDLERILSARRPRRVRRDRKPRRRR